jgi:predicted nucleotidyltransferase
MYWRASRDSQHSVQPPELQHMEIHWAEISAVILAENSEEQTRYVHSKANSECPLAYPMVVRCLFEHLRLLMILPQEQHHLEPESIAAIHSNMEVEE